MNRLIAAGIAALAMLAPSAAQAQRKVGGDGDWANTRYELMQPSFGVSHGPIEIDFDNIRIITPRDYGATILHLSGVMARAQNTTNQPLCFVLEFEPSTYDDVSYFGGQGRVYYLGAHQKTGYIAGVHNDDDAPYDRQVGLVKVRTRYWTPISKRQCGEAPAG